MPKKPGAAPAPSAAREPAEDVTEPRDDTIPSQMPSDPDGDERAATRAGNPGPIVDTEPVSLEDEGDFGFIVLYGQQGAGKTTAMAQILRGEPEGKLLIIAAEPGLKVRALRSQGVPTERIAVWPPRGQRPNFDAFERLIDQLDAQLTEAKRAGKPKPYCAVDLDSATEVVQLFLDNIVEENTAGARAVAERARAAGVAPPARRGAMRARFKRERDDYGLVSTQMRSAIRRLRYMDLHVLVTALVRRDEDNDTGRVQYGPALPPALQQDFLGYADVVGSCGVERDEKDRPVHYVEFVSDGTFHAKDRYNALPTRLEGDYGIDRILAIIRGGEVPEVDSPDSSPADTPEEDPAPAESTDEEPAKKTPARRTRAKVSTARGSGHDGRIDVKVMRAVGEGDGSNDEPPF